MGGVRRTTPAGHRRTTRTAAALVRALNDPGRGPLLDALLEVRARTASGKAPRPGWAAETLATLADALLARLADAGVRPLHQPGEILRLGRSRIAGRYEYVGLPFRPGERAKRVVVAAPGWTVGRRVVLRPTVREAAPDEGRDHA
jgi:hypothetical protein